jgi:DNA-binding NarL/FixJ family response regulator
LIVDDHPEFRAVARIIVERAGFEVVAEVADGEAALAAVADTDPDVVLLDVRLPGLDGMAVAELLVLRNSPPAVVLTSSSDAASHGERLAAAPVRGFIPKERLTARALTELLIETSCDSPDARPPESLATGPFCRLAPADS